MLPWKVVPTFQQKALSMDYFLPRKSRYVFVLENGFFFFFNNYKSQTILLINNVSKLFRKLATQVTQFHRIKSSLRDSISIHRLFFCPSAVPLSFFQAPKNPSQFFLLHLNPFLKILNPNHNLNQSKNPNPKIMILAPKCHWFVSWFVFCFFWVRLSRMEYFLLWVCVFWVC